MQSIGGSSVQHAWNCWDINIDCFLTNTHGAKICGSRRAKVYYIMHKLFRSARVYLIFVFMRRKLKLEVLCVNTELNKLIQLSLFARSAEKIIINDMIRKPGLYDLLPQLLSLFSHIYNHFTQLLIIINVIIRDCSSSYFLAYFRKILKATNSPCKMFMRTRITTNRTTLVEENRVDHRRAPSPPVSRLKSSLWRPSGELWPVGVTGLRTMRSDCAPAASASVTFVPAGDANGNHQCCGWTRTAYQVFLWEGMKTWQTGDPAQLSGPDLQQQQW